MGSHRATHAMENKKWLATGLIGLMAITVFWQPFDSATHRMLHPVLTSPPLSSGNAPGGRNAPPSSGTAQPEASVVGGQNNPGGRTENILQTAMAYIVPTPITAVTAKPPVNPVTTPSSIPSVGTVTGRGTSGTSPTVVQPSPGGKSSTPQPSPQPSVTAKPSKSPESTQGFYGTNPSGILSATATKVTQTVTALPSTVDTLPSAVASVVTVITSPLIPIVSAVPSVVASVLAPVSSILDPILGPILGPPDPLDNGIDSQAPTSSEPPQ